MHAKVVSGERMTYFDLISVDGGWNSGRAFAVFTPARYSRLTTNDIIDSSGGCLVDSCPENEQRCLLVCLSKSPCYRSAVKSISNSVCACLEESPEQSRKVRAQKGICNQEFDTQILVPFGEVLEI